MQTKGTERGSYFWIVLSFAAEVTAMLALVYWARRCSSLSGLTQNKPKKLLLYYLQAKLWLSEWSFTCHKRHKKKIIFLKYLWSWHLNIYWQLSFSYFHFVIMSSYLWTWFASLIPWLETEKLCWILHQLCYLSGRRNDTFPNFPAL